MIKFTKIFLFTILAIFAFGFIANEAQALNGSASTTVNVTVSPVNGNCGATHYICDAGTSASNVSGSSAWTWSCNGSNGGTTDSCTENKPVPIDDAQCSTTHYGCDIGTSSNNLDLSTYYWWACSSTNGGATAYCTEDIPVTVPVKIDGNCGSAPSHYICNAGTSSYNSEYSTYYWWACSGSNGGSTAYCKENKPVATCTDILASNYGGSLPCTYPKIDGNCNPSHYICDVGTSGSPVDGLSAWTWKCSGSNGGTTDSCTENKIVSPVNGDCGPTPSHYICDAGTSGSPVNGLSAWTWKCSGSNGGTTDSCTENKTVATCIDPAANNYNQSGVCIYSTCQDSSANNYLTSYPCTYNKCLDPNADNYNQSGSCTYSTCQDPAANNKGGTLPCTYTTCQDSSANNYHVSLPCTYSTNTPTASLTIAPSSNVTSGSQSAIYWSSTNATSCTAGGPWSNGGKLSDNTGKLTDALTSDTTFTFTCINSISGKTATDSVYVTIANVPIPSPSPSPSPSIPTPGGWSIWNPERSNECNVDGSMTRTCTNPAPTNGGLQCLMSDGITRALSETINYSNTNNCPLINGVTVSSGGINISDTTSIKYNGKIKMDWTGENIKDCTCTYKDSSIYVDKPCPGFTGTSPYNSQALKRQTVYTISCQGTEWGTASITKKILVDPINTIYKEQ